MSSTTPGQPPSTTVPSPVGVSPSELGQPTTQVIATQSGQRSSRASGSVANIETRASEPAITEQPARDVRVSMNQLYLVPHLQEPPRRRNTRSVPRPLFKGNSTNNQTRPSHAPSPLEQFPGQQQDLSSGSLFGSITSSSLASSRASPLTPWSTYYSSSGEHTGSLSAPNLRPTASLFIPPQVAMNGPAKMRALNNTQSLASTPGFDGTRSLGPGVSPSTKSSFGPFYPEDLGVRDLRNGSSGTSPSPVSPITFGQVPSSPPHMTPSKEAMLPPLRQSVHPPNTVTPKRYHELHIASEQQRTLASGVTNGQGRGHACANPTTSRSFIETASSGTSQMTDEDATSSAPTPSKPIVPATSSPGSTPQQLDTGKELALYVEPPVWNEVHDPGSYKTQRMNNEEFQELFPGSFDILATMNADHYRMPLGSRVVCIKTTSVTNILMSLKNGVWACPDPVTERIMKLWNARASDSEKILFLFSVPGSKHYCGLAEVTSIEVDEITDFWDDHIIYKGTIFLSWLFCKVVPYDEIRSVVEKAHPDQPAMTATQMWNGMHYPEDIGRDVIRGYVQFPNIENLLIRPKNRLEVGTTPRRGGYGNLRGNHNNRGQPQHRLSSRTSQVVGRNDLQGGGRGLAETPRPVKQAPRRLAHSASASIVSTGRQPGQQRLPDSATATSFTPTALRQAGRSAEKHKGQLYLQQNGSGAPLMPMSAPLSGFKEVQGASMTTASPSPSGSDPFMDDPHKHLSPGMFPKFDSVARKSSFVSQSPRSQTSFAIKHETPNSILRMGAPKSCPSFGKQPESNFWEGGVQLETPLQHYTLSKESRSGQQAESPLFTPFNRSAGTGHHATPMQNAPHLQMPSRSPSEVSSQLQESLQALQFTQSFPLTQQTPTSPFGILSLGHSFPPDGASASIWRDQPTTPSPDSGHFPGHGVRGSKTKTSTDMRMNSWVDKLVGSPVRKSSNSHTTSSDSLSNDMSDT
ncbi:hypothetical protein BDV97DRAFT_368473 [Delphinella strobiligena]|nr:hypothetical protein BDV97DRAFT_368473 [Delphinella strobiligena]